MDTPDLSQWIFRGCDPQILGAVKQVVANWKGYSPDPMAKRSLVHLIEKYLDPVVKEYLQRIPEAFRFSLLGGGQETYSRLIRSEGYRHTRDLHTNLERGLMASTNDIDRDRDDHLSTLSTIYSLIWLCELKKQKRLQIRDKDGLTGGLNQKLDRERCKICGDPTEFSAFLSSNKLDRGENDNLRYSYVYCALHKSTSDGGSSNAYRSSIRNVDKINKEFFRLYARSNCPVNEEYYCRKDVIRHYFYLYVRQNRLIQADPEDVRKHAIDFVTSRITDHKKIILYLTSQGLSQTEIAKLLNMKHRQSVSKALASIPDRFRLI